jgi:isopentenyl-diphosphate delta-isomerase
MSIASRKEQHVNLSLSGKATFREKTAGFERYEFEYCALPECDFRDVRIDTTFLGMPLRRPLMVTGMTGGYPDAERINAGIASACVQAGIAMGVGSMRAALTTSTPDPSFTVVREVSSEIPIIANLGAAQLAVWHRDGSLLDMVDRAVEMVGARALAVHLNPLQELLQPEGEPQFRGVLEAVQHLVASTRTTVIVKEVGAGISGAVAQRLVDAGVTHIDVAGAGGTSWAGIEIMRRSDADSVDHLWDVGIPTAECIRQCRAIVPTLVASGGISNGTECATALALGAHIVGSARPMLEAFSRGGTDAIVQLVDVWELHIRQWMFLAGSVSLDAFRATSPLTKRA